MKKILSVVLLLAMCLSLFAACGEQVDTGLEAAKKFVHTSYIGAAANTPVDYQIMGVARVDGVEYKIEWTANSDKITFVRGEDKFVTVRVPEDNFEEVKYTLTGTISNAEGKTVTVTFERVVPARIGVPTEVTTGTYVIVWNGLSFSSLDASLKYGWPTANNVTVTDGAVSGHFKADVLSMTAVEGGFTMQDMHGRYIYMKGTYNNFNVDTTAPETGHIWQLLTDKDGNTFIVNKMNGKTLAYSISNTSWGAYEEINDDRMSKISLIPATAPEVDPEKPEPEKPDVPQQPTGFGVVEAPEADKAYKFGMVQGNVGKTYYLAGGMDGYYMATTEDVNAAIDVYLEATEGGYYFYTMFDGVKTYINMVISGTHVNGAYEATASTVYTWDAENKTIISNVTVGEKAAEPYWFGTRNDKNYSTMGPVAVSYNGFFGQFYGEVAIESTVGVIETPAADTAYKFGMIQGNVGKTFYLTGAMDGYYMATTEDINAAIDVYLEATEGGYYFYTMFDGVKTYINMVISGTHVNGAYEATASTVYTWDAANKTIISNVTVGEKAAEPYWFGTRNDKNYSTMGPVAVSYNGFFGQFYGEGGTATETPEQPEQPETPAEPESNADATISFADASSRTEMSADKQVWVANGITVTNDKAASTNDVKDYVGPVRFYANTSLTIAFTGMKTIKIYCNRDSDVTSLMDSLAAISGITASSDGKVVTITLAAAADSLFIEKLVAQVRVDKIEIFK